ncbi:MAG TPA: signal peptidase II [Gemmatimonadales bacterium]
MRDRAIRPASHPDVAASGTRCVLVAVAVVLIDQASKVAAAARLDAADLPLAGDAFLTFVHNDAFARGMSLGGATLPATLLLAVTVLLLVAGACAPLARVDRTAPLGLGLVAGATIGNAMDFLRTGRGAVDFIGVSTADGALVFNLADVAAYTGVALLAHGSWSIARHLRAGRAAHIGDAVREPSPASVEVVRPLPLFVEPDAVPRTDGPNEAPSSEVPPSHPDPRASDER